MNLGVQERPNTSAGRLNTFLAPRENLASHTLRHSPTSVDLHRDTGIGLWGNSVGEARPSRSRSDASRLSTLSRGLSGSFLSHAGKEFLNMVRSRIPKKTGTSQTRASDRRHHEALLSTSPNMATSSSHLGLRREPSRRMKAADRQRRHALSLPSGQSTARSSEDFHNLSRLQIPQHFTIGPGLSAKAAVQATRRQKEEEALARLPQAAFAEAHNPPSPDSVMEVDSAFGDQVEEDRMEGIQPSLPVGRDPTEALPNELFLQILESLEAKDLLKAELVSKKWHSLVSSSAVWRAAFMSAYGRERSSPAPYIQIGGAGLGSRNGAARGQDWRKMIKTRRDIEQNWQQNRPKAIYFEGHTDSVYCCQFDEDKIITGSRDRTIRVWDLHTYECLKVIGGPAFRPALPSDDQERLATVDATVHTGENLNGTKRGDQLFHIPRFHHAASILCLQYDDEILVTGSSDFTCIVWDMSTYEPITRLQRHQAGVLDVCIDGDFIISCSKDYTICVWSRHTYELLRVLKGHNGPVNAVQLRGKLLASASGDGRCKLWDLSDLANKKTSDEILVRTFDSADRGLAAVEFTDDMKFVLAGGNDMVIYKFECDNAKEPTQYTGHDGLVRSLFLDYNNKRVLSGSYDQSIRIYDFESRRETGTYENWTTSWILAAKCDYRRIVATSQDGRVLLMDFGLDVDSASLLSGNGRESPLHPVLVRKRLTENQTRAGTPWADSMISDVNHGC